MADVILTPVAGSLVEFLFTEAKRLGSVHQKASILQAELEMIQSLLQDNANAWSDKGERSNSLKVLVTQLSFIAERIEDVLDEYVQRLKPYRRQSHTRLLGCLGKACFFAVCLKPRYIIASEIEDILESLTAIKTNCQSFGLRPLEQGSSSQTTNIERHNIPLLGDHDPFIEEDELVGIDLPMNELKIKLLGGQSVRLVISLVGEGGIGKSTLARKIYNDATVKQYFDNCQAWITVSQSYNQKTLLKSIIGQLFPEEKFSTEECDTQDGLIIALRQKLQTKRYLVVLDDVWQNDFWNVIKRALPINQRGSRIIITTRNANVAASCKDTPFDIVQDVQALSPDLSLELFYKKAFRFGGYRAELEKWSRMIVRKCHGLPLVISVVAALLSTKEKNEYEWRNVLNKLSDVLEEESVSKILLLSFLDLPPNLKNCLLYLAVFPEDSLIHHREIYGLWIAEGFVEARRSMRLDQVAKEYLEELIYRNLVQCEYYYGVEENIRIHDVMREMIISRADEFRVCQIFSEKNESTFERKSRRLSIHGSMKTFLENIEDFGVRSINYASNTDDELSESSLVTLFEKFKLLKVLNLAFAPLRRLPKEVGTLFHLRLLSLKGTMVEVVPTSIGKLHNLQSLDLSYSSVKMLPESIGELHNLLSLNVECSFIRELPITINKLRKLQFLVASHSTEFIFGIKSVSGVKIHEGIGNMKNLHTLAFVEVHPRKVGVIKELLELRKLSCLSITNLSADVHGRTLCSCIEKMENLKGLNIYSSSENEILGVQYISSPHFLDLQSLGLKGRLESFPDWIMKLQNLRGLELSFSSLISDPVASVGDLPNLVFLALNQAYDGEELHFDEGRFLKLKELHLRKLEGLRVLKIDRGALLRLEVFKIGDCQKLKEVTTGIQSLGKLKDLTIYDMPVEFTAMIHGYFRDLRHAPYIRVSNQFDQQDSASLSGP